MTTYELKADELESLRGRTILITGASTGIGRETARIAHKYGANVAIGDWNEEGGHALAKELRTRILFQKTDVSNWDDVVALFEAAWKKFGVINAVCSNAGINSGDNLLQDEFDPSTGKFLPPKLKQLEVNLTGSLYVVKCAMHYFAKWPETRCQIVMTASAANFLDLPPLHLYCAGKAGILGLMRSLRTQVVKKNVTINVVCPWVTMTQMATPEILKMWGELPISQPEVVALALLIPVVRPEVNGKAFFVAGHQIVELEDKIHETRPLWMGKELSAKVDEGQLRLFYTLDRAEDA